MTKVKAIIETLKYVYVPNHSTLNVGECRQTAVLITSIYTTTWRSRKGKLYL